ncbi:hypothetical protein [Flavobacterium sp. SORGH_AS_0622]|uniref:hypothetical protein n=1 Tax=Flavobacterium sp. SORGH_AS_0622 TaxID=3041772 RepID=UPI0027878D9E|nr:hypothetical protein [Flavobacterium sp. SORGH_AS_0622]MDQ1165628.1 hypothetical protein [Flavobacterium sp. SORGH_AS_0622]
MKIYAKTILTAMLISVLNYSCDALCGDEEDRSYSKKTARADTLSLKDSKMSQ